VRGTLSGRVHGRYKRRLSGTALAEREAMIQLTVRRFLLRGPHVQKGDATLTLICRAAAGKSS
jgi:hypothetical protein